MTTIWKAVLERQLVQDVYLPPDAEILCAHAQFERVCIWFRIDPDEPPLERRQIAICPTGGAAPPPDEARYIGTALLSGGAEVVHVFERIKRSPA